MFICKGRWCHKLCRWFLFQWFSSALPPYLWLRSLLHLCSLWSTTSLKSVWMPSRWSGWRDAWFPKRPTPLVSCALVYVSIKVAESEMCHWGRCNLNKYRKYSCAKRCCANWHVPRKAKTEVGLGGLTGTLKTWGFTRVQESGGSCVEAVVQVHCFGWLAAKSSAWW